MNKTAIRNFAIWARQKLISDITYKAGFLGISDKGISDPLPISTGNIQFFDIGTGKPIEISNEKIKQRKALVTRIREKESTSDYKTAYQYIVEEVAYTWFNRLIALRFMEVNDYIPSRVRVLSSHIQGKSEPDIVTTPFDTDIEFSAYEQDRIMQLKDENMLDELFRMLFIKQCNNLNEVLPGLFEKTADYTELLLNISFTDQEGIVNHLINDIAEEDFTEAVEIIGWLYQYYNEERKNEVINIYKGTVKKEDIPAATQLFTTDWVVRYMVDNSLGRYWVERNPQSKLQEKLEYFVAPKSGQMQYVNEKVLPEDLTFFDPCMGSGHILVYAFDVLMEIYRESGYLDRDAAREIVEKNIFGLDIDDRAYQLAYFAVMMKARSYDRRFLTREVTPKVYPIYDYTDVSTTDNEELQYLIEEFKNAKQYGSLVNIREDLRLDNVRDYIEDIQGQLTLETVNITKVENLLLIVDVLMNKYAVVCTNPPYLNKMNGELKKYMNLHYKDFSIDLFSAFIFKNFDYCKKDGYSAFMTPFVWMFIKKYEKLREFIINNKAIITLTQMEYSAFEEATVPICSFILKNGLETDNGLYFKLTDFKGGMNVQKEKVIEAIKSKNCEYFYEISKEKFHVIPDKPVAYWASDSIFDSFEEGIPVGEIADVKRGMTTSDNKRFLRYWAEVDFTKIKFNARSHSEALESKATWFPYSKGGGYRKWYGYQEYLIDWENEGQRVIGFAKTINKSFTRTIVNMDYYFKPSVGFSYITSGPFSMRWIPEGFLYDSGGPGMFASEETRKKLLGCMNSKPAQLILKLISPTINLQIADIVRMPFLYDNEHNDIIINLVDENIELSRLDWNTYETSWNFMKHPLLGGELISLAYNKWEKVSGQRFEKLRSNEEELNNIFIKIYKLEHELNNKVHNNSVSISRADLKSDIKSLISYAVGCMFGRFSLNQEGIIYAGGVWDGNKYTNYFPDPDNCIPITDEEYFEDDIVGRFIEFVKVVYGSDTLEENLNFISKALGNRGVTSREVIRNYFMKDFFMDHVKTYQKRPIYWLYDSGKKNGFKALVYMHRYTADTTGIVRVDYLHKIQKIYISEIDRMQDMIENDSHARGVAQAEKRREKLIKQLKETKDYDEKIAHIALSRVDIDLDDGVKVNYEKVQIGQDGKKLKILAKI